MPTTQGTPNRNIIWNNNSCWINSGLQCMTTFYEFRTKLNALHLKENSLEFKLKTVLNELTKNQNTSIDTSDFYEKIVSLGIGAMGTGGGDFAPNVLFYLLTNRTPKLKYLFRQVHQIKQESTIKKLSAKAREAQAQIKQLRNEFTPKIKSIPPFTLDLELRKKRLALANELNEKENSLNQIIEKETTELFKFEYRTAYHWSIKSFKDITEQDSSLVTFPKYLLLNFIAGFNEEIPLTINPYGCSKKYHLQAKGLSSSFHATAVVKSNDNNSYFYDDFRQQVTPVHEEVIKNKKYNNYTTDFLYYQAEDSNDIFIDTKNMTALHWAALCNNLGLAQQEIMNGALIDARTTTLETPLHFAALAGSSEIIKLLKQNGAEIKAQNDKQMTPLSFAIEQFNFKAIQYLMKQGADINQTYHSTGRLSLSHLISVTTTQNKEIAFKIIQFIITHGVSKNVLDDAIDACSKNNSAELREQIAKLLKPNPLATKLMLLKKQLFNLKKKLSKLKRSINELKNTLS